MTGKSWILPGLPEKASNVSSDKGDSIVVAEFVDLDLLAHGGVGQNNDLKLVDHVGGDFSLSFQKCHRYVAVQLGETRDGDLSSRFANISLSKEELRERDNECQ